MFIIITMYTHMGGCIKFNSQGNSRVGTPVQTDGLPGAKGDQNAARPSSCPDGACSAGWRGGLEVCLPSPGGSL